MENKVKKIFIATGIYPPEIGGQGEYAKNLKEIWQKQGFIVFVGIFSKFNKIPSGLRHIVYMFYIIPQVIKADYVFIVDTFSASMPAFLIAKFFHKKIVVRMGGDFLWESYIRRTNKKVSIKIFYEKDINGISFKEKIIFSILKYILKNVDSIIWSTEWQKNIFMDPYKLGSNKHFVVENYFGPKEDSEDYRVKNFVAGGRSSGVKNIEILEKIFKEQEIKNLNLILDTNKVSHNDFLDKVKKCYAVILVSLSDISPNIIMDALRYSKPFVVTRDIGIYERIKDVALFIDPLDAEDIKDKIKWLADENNYNLQKNKLKNFNFTHSWEQIASEYMSVYDN